LDTEPYQTITLFINIAGTGNLSGGIIASIFLMLLFLFFSWMMSASEVAYFSLSPSQLEILSNSKGKFSAMVLSHLKTPERLLATILITNSFANVATVVLSSYIISTLFVISGPSWAVILIQVVVVTSLILFVSEIFPKIYANRFSIKIAHFTAPALKFFEKFFWPISSFLIYSTSIINKRLATHTHNISINELSEALELTENQLNDEKNILKGIVKFGDIDVCEIMRPRVDTVAAEINTSFDSLLKIIEDSGYSRIPVFEDTFDNIRGILYVKDLLPYLSKPTSFNWQSLIRPSYFVPESKKINDLLKEFQAKRIHMAIVVDEYGGTSGIVTLEDVLEEIVGEITDESDIDELTYEKIDDKNFVFEGKTSLNDFYKVVDVEDTIFEEVKGEADTLAGLILEIRGEIPKVEDKIRYKDYLFCILSVDKRRIKKIKVTIT
jgi:putative hemolysin